MLRAQDRGIKREAGAVVATKSEGNGIGKFGIGAKEAVRKNPAAPVQRLPHMPPPALTPPFARHLRPVLLHGGRRRDRDEMCRR